MDTNKKKITKILIVLVVLALICIVLAQFYSVFISITMFVFAILCFVLAYANRIDRKAYTKRVEGWDQVMDEKENKMVAQEKKSMKIRFFVFILFGLILIWAGISTIIGH